MNDVDDKNLLDITELQLKDVHIYDGAQHYKDYDDVTHSEYDNVEDMVSLFRAYDGRY